MHLLPSSAKSCVAHYIQNSASTIVPIHPCSLSQFMSSAFSQTPPALRFHAFCQKVAYMLRIIFLAFPTPFTCRAIYARRLSPTTVGWNRVHLTSLPSRLSYDDERPHVAVGQSSPSCTANRGCHPSPPRCPSHASSSPFNRPWIAVCSGANV